jgi:hypothetical protein
MKPFTWSYTAVKNFETCPKQYYHRSVAKDVKEPESEALSFGKALHDHFAKRLGPKKTPMPFGFGAYEKWATKVEEMADGAPIMTELEIAVTRDFKPTAWLAKDVWFRAKLDVLIDFGDSAVVLDWKTGKIDTDAPQLGLFAAAAFVERPTLKSVMTGYVFLKEDHVADAVHTPESQVEFWNGMLPRVKALENAWSTSSWPASPSGLCRWCPVSHCPHKR